ncbi:hypothetical protein RFI_10706 [Reticulomyxa filosa]|uniref:Uncharacterized protein n=1 Tax=Reticulomyxa filosa TaxID=46433 RepID=X6NL53_RETFI|nr:hypothetical protein RFI_10706 [Reticulomyxa filosa]|eukprot:ETO26429.1 hypothetical protein RFI_10706 [Reticulomyxa filosa]
MASLKKKSTKAEKNTKFVFGEGSKQAVEVIVRESSLESQYLHVWPGGILMSEYLFNNPDIVSNKVILELGAGVGLPGLLAAKLGAKQVILTDATQYDSILQNINTCIELNSLTNAKSLGLTWGRFSKETIQLRANVILGADVFYDERDFENILANVQYYFDRGCDCFYTAIHNRGTSRPLGVLLLKWKMNVEEIDISHLIMNSNYLSLTDAEKLRLVKITSHKSTAISHHRIKSMLGLE